MLVGVLPPLLEQKHTAHGLEWVNTPRRTLPSTAPDRFAYERTPGEWLWPPSLRPVIRLKARKIHARSGSKRFRSHGAGRLGWYLGEFISGVYVAGVR